MISEVDVSRAAFVRLRPTHIMILDDDEMAALVTQRGLQTRLGTTVDVQVAASPEAAWLHCVHERVDLLIIDPHPRNQALMSLLKTVRSEQPHILVVVLTAYDTPRLRAEVRKLGVQGYFAKPVELMYLERGIREALCL